MTALAHTQDHQQTRSGLWLAAAPVVLLMARLLAAPVSNKPSDFIADVHVTAGRTEFGAALAVLGAALLVPTLAALAQHARLGARRLGMIGGVLACVGCLGMVLVSALQAIGARMSVQDQPVVQLTALFDEIYNRGALPVVAQFAIVCGAVGGICLGIALYRADGIARPVAVLAGVGTFLLFATAPGPVQPFLVLAAALAAVGYAGVGIRPGAGRGAALGETSSTASR